MQTCRINFPVQHPFMMRKCCLVTVAALIYVSSFPASGQPTIYQPDPSWLIDRKAGGDDGTGEPVPIQKAGPWLQSFRPGLPGIDFADIATIDLLSNGIGVTLSLQLREGSIDGAVLGTAGPINLPDGFVGINHFAFPSRITLEPGNQYFLQPVVLSGGEWFLAVDHYGVPGQPMYQNGNSSDVWNFWFREGIVIPEPSAELLFLLLLPTLQLIGRSHGPRGRSA